MMNVLALILVATSLVTAGVFSPPAAPHKQVVEKDVSEVIVKEGHRVIVVEYDEKVQSGVGNTKVSISPPHEDVDRVDQEQQVEEGGSGGGVKEVICDAFGKCKHVVTSVVGGGKRKVSDKVDEVEEKVKDVGDSVGGKVEEVKEGVKKAVVGSKDEVVGRTQQGADMLKEGTRKGAGKAKEVVHSAQKGTEKAKETVHNVHDKVTSVGKEMGEKAKRKVKEGVEVAEEAIESVAEKAKVGAEKVKEEGKQELREIYDLSKQLMKHIWGYLAWGRTLDAVSKLVHLIGFSMAYGMAVWVTFVSSNVLSRALPRQQFGVVQSKIYPVYFRAMQYSIGLSLLGHLLGRRTRLWSDKADMFQGYNLAFALGMVMINLYYLEPRASKVMLERMREEKEEGRGRDPYIVPESAKTTTTDHGLATPDSSDSRPSITNVHDKYQEKIVILSERLKKLNSQSSLVNVMSLMSLTWHLVYLSQQVHAC